MYIKRITIQGFKSFGSKRVVIKLGPGLTVITGPNGGGKSTVVDAIKFALGELSAHSLRAGRFSELIHESPAEGRLSSAKVSLTFNNTDKSLPVDGDEVTVTRKLANTGESEYMLNGKQASRNDILTILSAANIKPDGLNIVTQGSVIGIAEMNSNELRRVIEDIAGIAEYKKRREEAYKQLDIAERNLEVAKAGTSEVRNRVKQLERERNQYLRRLQCELELNKLKTIKLRRELEKLENSLSELDAETASVMEKVAEVQDKREEHIRRREELERRIAEINSHRISALQRADELENKLNTLRAGVSTLHRRRMELENSLSQLAAEESMLHKRREELSRRISETKAEKEEKERELPGTVQRLQETEQELRGLQQELNNLRQTLNSKEQEMLRLANELRRYNITEDGRILVLEEIEQQLKEVRREIEEVTSRIDSTYQQVKSYEEEEKRLLVRVDEAQQRGEELKAVRERIKSRIEKLSSRKRIASEHLRKLELVGNTLSTLLNSIKPKSDGSSPAGDFPTLRSLIKTDPENSRMLNALLNCWLDALVCYSPEEALELAKAASSNNIPIRILAVTRHADENEDRNGIDIAGEEEVASFLRKLYRDVDVLESVEELSLDHRGRVVTRDGVFYQGGGMIYVAGSENPGQALAREIHSQLALVEELKKKAVEAMRRIEERMGGLEVEENNLTGEMERLRREADEARSRIRVLQERVRAARDVIADLERRRERLGSKAAELEERAREITEAKPTLDSKASTLRSVTEEVNRLRAKLRELEEKNSNIRNNHSRLNSEVAVMERTIQLLDSRIREMLNELERIEPEIEKIAAKRLELSLRIKDAEQELEAKEAEINSLSSEIQRIRREGISLESEIEKLRADVRDAQAEIDRLSEEKNELEKRLNMLRIERVKIETQANVIREKLTQLGLHPSSTAENSLEKLADVLIPALEEELRKLEAVNQLAPSQYESIIPNYKLRSSRINELEIERQEIIELIRKIDAEELNTFMKTLEKVSENFRFFFHQITGGEAWLRLEKPDEPLKSGVEMIVKFIGKTARSSSAVSGGEKSVAATALILALQGLTPAEFYIFDEIDAHLDINYTARLVELLKEMSKHRQIIVVSLKDVIAERADMLYGVYMRNGVSSIVKTSLEEVETLVG